MRLIHTADWQIGKVFRFVDQATMGVLQEARLEAISTLGRLALEHAAPTVLVAGAADRFYSVELFEETARLVPGCRLRVLPGGHVSVARDPGWAEELRRFAAGS